MKKIKSYLVFTSFLYRLVMFLVIHTIILGLLLFLPVAPYMEAAFLAFFEIVSDNWLFGGICSKEAASMDYLKSSKKGMQVLTAGLTLDLVRRFFYSALWMSISFFYARSQNPNAFLFDNVQTVCFLATSILLTYSLSVAGIMISRFFSNYWINTLISYAAIILLVLIMFFAQGNPYIPFLTLVFSILVSVLSVRLVIKKMKESYYDK